VWNFGTACKLGNACIDFPAGTNYISVPDASNLDIVNNLTISMWIKMVTLSPSGGSTHPIAKWSGTSDANYVLYYCGSACGSGSTYDWYGNAGGVWSWIVGGTSSIISADGQWHQISLTYSSGGVFYWDGVSVATKTSQGNLATSAAALKIGMDGGSGDEWVLDDVRVYNRSLSAAEIRALYNAGK
jgi:hypothetical protein